MMTESEIDWPQEEIPNEDILFMRVHRQYIAEGKLLASAFKPHGAGLSTNWQKYCVTAEEARQKAKNPQHNGIISLGVGPTRAIPLKVVHTPCVEKEHRDRSHTDVSGITTETRLKLLEISKWEIKLADDQV